MDSKKSFLSNPTAILIGSIIIAIAILVAGGTISVPLSIKNFQLGTTKLSPTPIAPTGGPDQEKNQGLATVTPTAPGIKTFSQKKNAQVYKEDGKPVIYLFSTTWCPHCEWIAETFDKVAKEYVDAGKIKAYHWELDTSDNTLTAEKETQIPEKDMAVYQEFNPAGSIPTFVFSGKYFRTGNGYERQQDLKAEEAEFKAVIEDLLK